MADIFRGPLYVNKRELEPVHQFSAWIAPSLLTTVLAVAGQIPLPLSAAHALPLQVELPRINADTTQDQPLTLRPIAAPFVVPPHAQPLQHPRLEWLPQDTSAGIPLELRAVVILPPPPGLSFQLAPLRFWWQPQDTTGATPKGLFGDAVPPLVDTPAFAPLHKPALNWLPADTSQTAQVVFLPPGTVTPPTPPVVIIEGGAGPKPKSRRHWVIVGRQKQRLSEDEIEILTTLGTNPPRIIAVQTEPGKPRQRVAIIETVDAPQVPLRVSRLKAPAQAIQAQIIPPDLGELERIVRTFDDARKKRADDDEDDLEAILWSL